MINFLLNGKKVEALAGETIFKVAQRQGVEIPHLCYSDEQGLSGNCRACMVEVEGERDAARHKIKAFERQMVFFCYAIDAVEQGCAAGDVFKHPVGGGQAGDGCLVDFDEAVGPQEAGKGHEEDEEGNGRLLQHPLPVCLLGTFPQRK